MRKLTRGGRADARHGSDWLIGKSHDSFAALGPFVVPREFVPDPQKLGIFEYASYIITLQPGDILSTGSPAGVGTARATPIYMKAGDTPVCTIESIGTLTNPVEAERPRGTR